MSTQVQHRRGTTVEHADFTGAAGEITVDTTKKTAVVHDGSTAGGIPLQKEDAELTALAGVTSAANKVPYFTGPGTASVADLTAAGRSLIGGTDAAAQRSTLGLGTAATQASTAFDPAGSAAAVAADLATHESGTTEHGISAFGATLVDDADAATARATLGVVIGTNVQAYSANLGALGGVTSAADKGVYFTGSGSAGTFDLTSYGRALCAHANAAAARTGLGLVIGTDVQAQDAELAAIAGLTSAADTLAYFTGSGTASLATFTSFGRSLVDDADATAARGTLGLGTIATQAASAVAITGGSITGMSAPSGSSDVATKGYVDGLVAGLKWKASVVAATTGAGTLASSFANGSTVDGVTLATGDRILIKDQSTGSENGIYVVAASGAPTRATDADAGAELVNAAVFIEQGTANADKAFVCTNNSITLGSTSVVFTNFAASTGALLATNNLSDVGSASSARSNLGLGALATKSATATGDIDNDAVTFAKMQNVASDRLIGRDTTSSGDPEELTVGGGIEFTGSGGIQRSALTGDVTASAGSNATTIANDAVTYAKMQNVSATDRILGRSTSGAGDVEEIACTAAARSVLDDSTVAAMVDTLGGASSTGTGGLARATSPAFTTPNIGTPSAGNLSNCTSIPAGQLTGTVATARLGSGTANASKVLRGDQTWSPVQLAIVLNAVASANVAFSAQPAADTLFLSSVRHIQKADLTNFSQVRFLVNKTGNTGATGATLHLRYHTSYSTTVGDYVAIGTSALSVAVDTASSVYLDTGWIDLASGAKADVFLAVVGAGGDASASPQFGAITAQFR